MELYIQVQIGLLVIGILSRLRKLWIGRYPEEETSDDAIGLIMISIAFIVWAGYSLS